MQKFNRKFPIDIIFILTIIIIGFKIAYQSEKIIDISLSDESVYLNMGVNFQDKKALDGLFYFAWYKFLSFFEPDNFNLYFLNYSILLVLPAVIFYLLLKAYRANSFIAFLFTVVFIISTLNVWMWPYITKFALCIFLAGLIILVKIEHAEYKLLFSLLLSFVLSYVRPEFFLSFVLLGISLLIYIIINRKKISLIKFLKLSTSVIVLTALILYYNPARGPRSFLAFAQHYVLDINERKGIINSDISESILKEHFGDDDTILEVALNRHGIFFEHVGYNLLRFPSHIADIFPYSNANFNIYIKQFMFALVILILIISLIIYFKFYNWKFLNVTNLIYFIFVLPTIIINIIFYPRIHYMYIIEPLILVFSCCMISHYLEIKKFKIIDKPGIAVLTFVIFIFAIPFRFNGISIHDSSCTSLNILKSINNVKEDSHITLMAVASGILPYLNKNISLLSPKYFNIPFEQFMEKYNVNMVLVNSDLLKHRNIINNPEFIKLKTDSNFVVVNLEKCQEQLIINKNILR